MFVEENSASIYLQGMRDRSMRSGTKFAREIQLTDWSTAGNLFNRSSGVQIPRDICIRFWRYLYSARCSWIISSDICPWTLFVLAAHSFPRTSLSENCSLLGTDNVRRQISAHIFASNGGYCLFIIRQSSLQGNLTVVIGYFLVGISPYGSFPLKRS